MIRYLVARCRLCRWQWAITSEQERTAEKGCPNCGCGENMIEIREEGRETDD